MTKAEFIQRTAASIGISKAAAERTLNALLGCIHEEISKEGKVTFSGFGAFELRTRIARNGRNPRTGKAIKIPAKKFVGFRAGKRLSHAIKK